MKEEDLRGRHWKHTSCRSSKRELCFYIARTVGTVRYALTVYWLESYRGAMQPNNKQELPFSLKSLSNVHITRSRFVYLLLLLHPPAITEKENLFSSFSLFFFTLFYEWETTTTSNKPKTLSTNYFFLYTTRHSVNCLFLSTFFYLLLF